MKSYKFGILGGSEGNGHPYSWSAIMNGYNQDYMKDCPYPVIPEYLAKESFPDTQIKNCQVTHVWSTYRKEAEHVARAANIDTVVDEFEDMIGEVDAVLLARDDAENHYDMAKPFLDAGLPVYIDKPLAYSVEEARRILSLEKYPGQVFSCSALAFSKDLSLSESCKSELGKILQVSARVVKSWEKYGVHVIEPVLNLIGRREVASINRSSSPPTNRLTITFSDNTGVDFVSSYKSQLPIEIDVFGSEGAKRLTFGDTFYAFKAALMSFVCGVASKKAVLSHQHMLEVVKYIEMGIG